MGKIISSYSNDIDKCWYDSSNVVYSECLDHDNALKEVKVVFKNGSEYTYLDVPVQDYLMFREAPSQGKALNAIIKKYKFVKSEEKRDLEQLNEEKEMLLEKARQALEEQNKKENTEEI